MGVGNVSSGVGKTALGVAMVRAGESRRRDRLFDDPYAEAFLAASPGNFAVEQRAAAEGAGDMASWGTAFWSHAVIRTRFFDDYLLEAVGDGLRQVVLLAAGLDTRAYRLPWADGVRLYELDLPDVLQFKERVLRQRGASSRCERTVVPVDLRDNWAIPLTQTGLSTAEPTAWLAEGLLTYLSPDEAETLFATVRELSAQGSRLSFEIDTLGSDSMRAGAQQTPTMQQYTKLWKGGLPNAPNLLHKQGWRTQSHDRATVSANYGRAAEGQNPSGQFITATLIDNVR